MDEENKTYSITLDDGTKLTNIKLSGNNYISENEISTDTFNGKLSTVIISDGYSTTTLKDPELVQVVHYSNGYYFILRERNPEEVRQEKVRADIDYIALMSNIELEA